MYAIAFDLNIDDLKKNYGEHYNNAYDEIRQELEAIGFKQTHVSIYINSDSSNSLTTVYKAINRLSKIDWFKKSAHDVHAFKVEDFSDFTEVIKNSETSFGIAHKYANPNLIPLEKDSFANAMAEKHRLKRKDYDDNE